MTVNQNAHWASPSLASGRPTIRGRTSQHSPVASSVPPPTIITCVLERPRTRWPAHPAGRGGREPPQPGREQCPAADDHHVRAGKVADEGARVAGSREVLRDPGQVLDDHVERAGTGEE